MLTTTSRPLTLTLTISLNVDLGLVQDNMRKLFHQIHVEALVDTAIAVGTASVLGKFSGGHDVSDELSTALAHQMELQTYHGLVRMKQRIVEDNVKHVFANVPSSFVNTGRRFSWSHSNQMAQYKDDLAKFRLTETTTLTSKSIES